MANLEVSRAKRLDQKVVELIPQLSRASATKLIQGGKVTVNDDPVEKGGYKLKPNDEVVIDFDIKQLDDIPIINLKVLYEDDDCVVVIKPAGLLTHSKGEFNPEATVETWLRSRTKLTGARAGIVHRLDRATSGVMICAKTPAALKWLQRQFSQRKVKKTYFAVVTGRFKQPQAIIDMPIERNPKAPATFRVGAKGKSATTAYREVETNEQYSLVELKPETGRTHQLRVHLGHIGHPIVGDYMYGGQEHERLLLHAYSLEITLPDRQRLTFHAPIPKEFKRMVQ